MDAAVLREFGLPSFGSFRDPVSFEQNAVVKVEVAALNPTDIQWASGKHYLGAPELPNIPGREGVGRLSDGQRVYFDSTIAPFGSMAQLALVARDEVAEIPESLDGGLAVAIGIPGVTAWLALQAAQLRPEETVLVLGATGSVGQIAIQAAKLLGAGRVVAVGRGSDLERTLSLGADATVALTSVDELPQLIVAAAEGRVDVIIDPLWGAPAVAALDTAADGARLVQIGSSAAGKVAVEAASLRRNRVALIGFFLSSMAREVRVDAYQSLVAHALEGRITADIQRVPLNEVTSAWESASQGRRGKIVLDPEIR